MAIRQPSVLVAQAGQRDDHCLARLGLAHAGTVTAQRVGGAMFQAALKDFPKPGTNPRREAVSLP